MELHRKAPQRPAAPGRGQAIGTVAGEADAGLPVTEPPLRGLPAQTIGGEAVPLFHGLASMVTWALIVTGQT